MISAVGVVVPARDERGRIRRCLSGLDRALRSVPARIETAVCVVADRCSDGTAQLASAKLAHGSVMLNRVELTIGEVRDLGCRQVLTTLRRHHPGAVLLLSTDADSVVAPNWVLEHVRLVTQGADAVAGDVELAGRWALPASVVAGHAAVLERANGPGGAGNVYAANLAVRAHAYRAVGGFGPVAVGEDHDLWRRLGAAGFRRLLAGPTVMTSARRHGRARGGLADLLHALSDRAPRCRGCPRCGSR